LGKTSNAAKQKWNSAHYSQVKASVKPETAAAFKAACAATGDTMAGVLSRLMLEYAGQAHRDPGLTPSTKTLKDRRKAAAVACGIVAALQAAEERYVGNAPPSLSGAPQYEMAEERASLLQDALDAIDEAYGN